MRGENYTYLQSKGNILDFSWELCWFCKVVIAGSLHYSLPHYPGVVGCFQYQFSSCQILSPIRELFVTIELYATTVPLGFSYRAGHGCGSQVSYLNRNVDGLPPLEVYLAPSGTMKASPRRGGFQVSFSSGIPRSVFEVHSVFSDRVLLTSFERAGNQG